MIIATESIVSGEATSIKISMRDYLSKPLSMPITNSNTSSNTQYH